MDAQAPRFAIDADPAIDPRDPALGLPAACFTCGTCSAGCPVAAERPEYSPRRFLRLALLGLGGRAAEDPALWLCTGCDTCVERCPQGVDPVEVIAALRNAASRRGRAHTSYKVQVKEVLGSGRIYPIDEFENENRQDLGLPPLTEDPLGGEAAFWKSRLARAIGEENL